MTMKHNDTTPHAAIPAGEEAQTQSRRAGAAHRDTDSTTATTPRRPYVAPAVEAITVRTERGYAASGTASPWDPTPW